MTRVCRQDERRGDAGELECPNSHRLDFSSFSFSLPFLNCAEESESRELFNRKSGSFSFTYTYTTICTYYFHIMNTPNSSSTNGNRIIPLTCSGHTRPVVDIQFSSITPQGKYYLISACKGKVSSTEWHKHCTNIHARTRWQPHVA